MSGRTPTQMSAVENLQLKLDKIHKREKEIHAFIDLFEKDALAAAKEQDAKIKDGKLAGPLSGLVLAVKSNICIKGRRATCASKMLEDYVAPYNATVIERLTAAGAIIIGTANMDEFACGSDGSYSAFDKTTNPHDISRVPGGSSAGSAAAVAAGFADVALGSDTGGSIRCPASFCGVVGLKPTYGTVSRYGLIDMGMSLDQIGPFAADVHNAKLVTDVITHADPRDQTTRKHPNIPAKPVEKMTVGVPKEFFEGVDERAGRVVRDGIRVLEKSGASIQEISLPHIKYGIPTYFLLVFSEFASAMQKYDGLRYGKPADISQGLVPAVSAARAAFGREVKRRILLGTYITMKEHREAWYSSTLRARSVIKAEFESALKKVDVLAGPAMPSVAWKAGAKSDPVQMYLSDILTCSANLAGVPAGVVPAGAVDGLPVGLQIHAGPFREADMFAAMAAVEAGVKLPWKK